MRKIKDLEAVRFCGEVYLFEETQTSWVMKRGAAISITFLKLQGEDRTAFNRRLRASEKEIEDRFCMSCTGKLCRTTSSECWLYKKNKYLVESEDLDG